MDMATEFDQCDTLEYQVPFPNKSSMKSRLEDAVDFDQTVNPDATLHGELLRDVVPEEAPMVSLAGWSSLDRFRGYYGMPGEDWERDIVEPLHGLLRLNPRPSDGTTDTGGPIGVKNPCDFTVDKARVSELKVKLAKLEQAQHLVHHRLHVHHHLANAATETMIESFFRNVFFISHLLEFTTSNESKKLKVCAKECAGVVTQATTWILNKAEEQEAAEALDVLRAHSDEMMKQATEADDAYKETLHQAEQVRAALAREQAPHVQLVCMAYELRHPEAGPGPLWTAACM